MKTTRNAAHVIAALAFIVGACGLLACGVAPATAGDENIGEAADEVGEGSSCGTSPSGPFCDAGLTCCGNGILKRCTNTQTSGKHCGACGVVCVEGESCTNGVCGCGTGSTCASDKRCCSGSCVNLFSNCSACGDDCINHWCYNTTGSTCIQMLSCTSPAYSCSTPVSGCLGDYPTSTSCYAAN